MKKGFTLLEMIIVIAVISTLLVLTVPNVQRVMGIVESKGCEAQLKIVDTAILEYTLTKGSRPGSFADLVEEELLVEEQRYCQNNREIYVSQGQAKLR